MATQYEDPVDVSKEEAIAPYRAIIGNQAMALADQSIMIDTLRSALEKAAARIDELEQAENTNDDNLDS